MMLEGLRAEKLKAKEEFVRNATEAFLAKLDAKKMAAQKQALKEHEVRRVRDEAKKARERQHSLLNIMKS